MSRLGAHIRNNLWGILALFVALGGVASAAAIAPKNTVVSKSIVDGQVKSADIGSGQVRTADIAGPGKWRAVTPNPAWTSYTPVNGDYAPLGCLRDQIGIVHLRGLVRRSSNDNGSSDIATVISALPAACRPSAHGLELVAPTLDDQTTGNGSTTLVLSTEGVVRLESYVPPINGFVSFDGISFPGSQ